MLVYSNSVDGIPRDLYTAVIITGLTTSFHLVVGEFDMLRVPHNRILRTEKRVVPEDILIEDIKEAS